MYNPALAPYVDHYEGNRRVWDYIEGEQASSSPVGLSAVIAAVYRDEV